jgi:hypothetical protein
MRMIRISVDKGGINIKVSGVNAISPIHRVVLYIVVGSSLVVGCMVYEGEASLVGL